MTIAAITTMIVAAGIQTQFDQAATDRLHSVPVCVQSAIVAEETQARRLASQMFLAAGVRLEWHRGLGQNTCPDGAIRITITEHADRRLPHNALAYAMPYEGKHIQVFYDRIQRLAQGQRAPRLLAHLMVHEITHILQGVARHSERGVMKAHWSGYDYALMALRPLPFTDADLVLIRTGLQARQAQMMVAMTARAPRF